VCEHRHGADSPVQAEERLDEFVQVPFRHLLQRVQYRMHPRSKGRPPAAVSREGRGEFAAVHRAVIVGPHLVVGSAQNRTRASVTVRGARLGDRGDPDARLGQGRVQALRVTC